MARRAQGIMQTNLISGRPGTTIEQAINIMLERRVSGMPVVDNSGRLVGIVSEGDLLRRVELGTERQRPRWLRLLLNPGPLADEYTRARGRQVGEVMTDEVTTVDDDTALEDIVELM